MGYYQHEEQPIPEVSRGNVFRRDFLVLESRDCAGIGNGVVGGELISRYDDGEGLARGLVIVSRNAGGAITFVVEEIAIIHPLERAMAEVHFIAQWHCGGRQRSVWASKGCFSWSLGYLWESGNVTEKSHRWGTIELVSPSLLEQVVQDNKGVIEWRSCFDGDEEGDVGWQSGRTGLYLKREDNG
ncbi:hypothetical protein Tco_1533870 [Tanacetum coccineum]